LSLSIFDAARDAPGQPALITPDRTFDFSELADLAAQARIDPRGTVVVGHLDVPTIAQLHACIAARAPAICVHPRWTERERRAALDDMPIVPESLAVVFTSGSSGAPRGVVLGRDAFIASAHASADNLGWRDDDRWLLGLSPAHVGGLSILTRCLLARRPVVLGSDDVLETIARQRVTLVSWVPAQLARLLDAHSDWRAPAHLRTVLLGGAAVPIALRERARERGLRVLASYGLTEACSQVTTERAPGASSGPPLPGIEVRIDDSRIQVRGPTLLSGYLRGGSPLDAEGWFTTGDLGHLDAAGNLHVLGRADDVIVTGGENVHPLELEAVLEADPLVREACIFGIDDESFGQRVAAALVLAPGADASAVVARAELASFKRPRQLFVLDSLTRTASGKLDRRATAAKAQRKSCTAQTLPPEVA
jgi:O-succinylbenzoic acid--CoA ligase